MLNINSDTRLTDELERELMMQAIQEQFRPHPLRALKSLLAKLGAGAQRANQPAMNTHMQSAH
jgi:hypothetical protein